MLWALMALLAMVGAILLIRRRRRYESPLDEPWRESLRDDDDELDVEEIRRAEEEWMGDGDWDAGGEDDEWQ